MPRPRLLAASRLCALGTPAHQELGGGAFDMPRSRRLYCAICTRSRAASSDARSWVRLWTSDAPALKLTTAARSRPGVRRAQLAADTIVSLRRSVDRVGEPWHGRVAVAAHL